MTFLFSKITGFACIRKDLTAALLCTARKTKGFCMERRQIRTCYDLAAETEEIPTLSSRAEVEDCLSSLNSLRLAPSSLLGLFLNWSWLRLLHLLNRNLLRSLGFGYLLRKACEAYIKVYNPDFQKEEGKAHRLSGTFCISCLSSPLVACSTVPYIVCGLIGFSSATKMTLEVFITLIFKSETI